MKVLIFFVSVLFFVSGASSLIYDIDESFLEKESQKKIIGKWVRIGSQGPMALILKEDGTAQGDFGNDGTIDVMSKYEVDGDIISFNDEGGAMCGETGRYKIFMEDYYLAFDLVNDNCGGRIKSTLGYWTRPEFKDFISELDEKLSEKQKPELLLTKARIFLAIGDTKNAKENLDEYIAQIDTNPRAYLNRATTKMPGDLEGVIQDCNQSIKLDPNNKNTFFLRGSAWYEMGNMKAACADYEKAIQLGFSVLRLAEQEKCSVYWKDNQ
jgi:tetratricopeptide (TPR) repeat protein